MESTGYDPSVAIQTESAILGINIISVFVPAIGMLLSAIAMIGFRSIIKSKED